MDLSTQTHFRQGWNTRLLENVENLGIDMIRDSVAWHKVEDVRGNYDFTDSSASWVSKALNAGFDVLIVFDPRNSIYDKGHSVHTDAGREAFANFVVATLKAFPGITSIEIGNEYNGDQFVTGPIAAAPHSARVEYYGKLVEAVSRALDKAGIDTNVIGASTHSVPVDYIAKLGENGTLDHLDGVSIHPYTTDAEQLGDQLKLLRDVIGEDKDIHVTEFGSDFARLEDAPAYLAKMVSVMAANGVDSANWYAFAKQSGFPNMELWDQNAAKASPAGKTFELLEDMLADGQAVKQIAIDSYTYFYSFGPHAAIIWGEPRGIELGKGVTAYDLAGNQIHNFDNLSPDTPVILRSTGTITQNSITLTGNAILADSYHDFDVINLAGNAAGFEGPWSYFAQSGTGKIITLETKGGDLGGGQMWTPFLGTDGLGSLMVNADKVIPHDTATGSKPAAEYSVVERFTADSDSVVTIKGTWDVSNNTEDGVILTIEINDRAIFSKVIYDKSNGHVFELELNGIKLEAGDKIDFVISARKTSAGDITQRHIQILDEKVDGSGPPKVPAPNENGNENGDVGEDTPPGGGTDEPVPSNPYDFSDAQVSVNLRGDAGNNVLIGGWNNDKLVGLGGEDRFFGGAGDDAIHTDAQYLSIDGGSGNDALYVTGPDGVSIDLAAASIERADGERGNDVFDGSGLTVASILKGFAGDDRLLGGTGDDRILGGDGDDYIVGGAGNDQLWGENGRDIIDAGAGDDRMTGGAGADVFRFSGNFGRDTITDFSSGDSIDLRAFASIDGLEDLSISYTRKDAIISIGDATIVLSGVTAGMLDDDSFLF